MFLCIVLGLVFIPTLDTLFLCHNPIVTSKKTQAGSPFSRSAYLEDDGTRSCS